jgi:anti-sigma B factor antagonist
MPDQPPIKLKGRLDSARVSEIETGFYANVGAAGNDGRVIVDMREVDFISSLGIRMLITAGKLLARRNIAVGVVSPASESVKKALDIAGLTDLFRFYDSEETARSAT